MDHILYPAIFVLAFVVVYMRLLVPYVGFFARYMFNERVGWDKYIEKPRLVFYGIGLLLMHLSSKTIFHDLPRSINIMVVLNWGIFLCGFYFCLASWSKRFKNVFIPNIKKKLRREKNFNISISNDQLKKLYNGLVRYDMLIQDKTQLEDFISVFKEDWDTHRSKIYFKFKGPGCREFYDLFKATFPKNTLTIIDFFKRSNTIRRADGNPYKYSTVKNTKTRTQFSKRSDELKVIFSNL